MLDEIQVVKRKSWNVKVDPGSGIIQIVFVGTIARQDARESAEKALQCARGRGPQLFLTDVLNADSELTVFDIFDIPGHWDVLGSNRKSKLALLAPGGGAMWEDLCFYETVCQNEGWNVRVFSEREQAIDWLTRGKTRH